MAFSPFFLHIWTVAGSTPSVHNLGYQADLGSTATMLEPPAHFVSSQERGSIFISLVLSRACPIRVTQFISVSLAYH